ncbi:MAG: hypothetical protein IJ094_11900 [Bacilli bacterium]|nr:hypothetical protein [Bacilli bacterium]
MTGLYGTEKQIMFATDIMAVTIDALEKHKKLHKELESCINTSIKYLSYINDSGFIINNLKEVCYTRKHNERMAIIIEYMAYSECTAYYELIDKIDDDVIKTLEKFDVSYDTLKRVRYL